MTYETFPPRHPALAPWIEEYVQITGDEPLRPKQVFPRAGSSLVFDMASPYLLDAGRFHRSVSGVYERPHQLHFLGHGTDRMVVRFTPGGLARFIATPVERLANRIVEPELLFGPSVGELHDRLACERSPEIRIGMVESFLLQRLRPLPSGEEMIIALAARIREQLSFDVEDLRRGIPLGERQLERRFKATFGVSMRSFARICRFEHAAGNLPAVDATLTEIGYGSGYFDQSHFIREFRRMADCPPGAYVSCAPIPAARTIAFAGSSPEIVGSRLAASG